MAFLSAIPGGGRLVRVTLLRRIADTNNTPRRGRPVEDPLSRLPQRLWVPPISQRGGSFQLRTWYKPWYPVAAFSRRRFHGRNAKSWPSRSVRSETCPFVQRRQGRANFRICRTGLIHCRSAHP